MRHRIYLTGSNEDVLQKMQKAGFNVTTCGDCGEIVLQQGIDIDELHCFNCGLISDPCDFPDLVVVDD